MDFIYKSDMKKNIKHIKAGIGMMELIKNPTILYVPKNKLTIKDCEVAIKKMCSINGNK